MFRASEEFGANDSAAWRTRGPYLVAHEDGPRSLRVVAGIRRCLGPEVALVPVPLAGVVDRGANGVTALVIVLPSARPGGVLGVLALAVDLVKRLGAGVAAAQDGDGAWLIVVGPRALLRHRRLRAALTRSAGVAWPDDDAVAGRGPDRGHPDAPAFAAVGPLQVLADRIAAWGVADAGQLTALREHLDAHLAAPAVAQGELGGVVAVLAALRRAVPGFRSPARSETDPALVADLRRLALEVRIVHEFVQIADPVDHPLSRAAPSVHDLGEAVHESFSENGDERRFDSFS